MAPLKPCLNSTNPGGRNVGAGSRLNQSRMRLAINSVSGSGSRNKSTLYGKVVKRNSSHLLRKNNVALAKALNTAKQQNAELNTLVMQYRERLHVAERLVQEYQNFRRDMRALFDQYPQRAADQNESDCSSTEPASQVPLLPRTERKSRSERSEYQAGVRDARTQLVNPMVQGMSINKVKVCLERINDVPRPRALSLREPGYAPEPNQRASLQEAGVRSSPGVAARSQRQEESRSPVNDDITMDFTMVQQLRPSGGQFFNSLRVPSLTLQRLSLQDIQRTTSAHLDDAVVELSTDAQAPVDRSGSVQLEQSIYLAEGDSVTSCQSAHDALSGEHDAIRNPELPSDGGGQTEQSPTDNPLEGSSWMFENSRVSKRIKMRDRRSLHQSKRKRYSVKTLAAKENFSDAVFGNFASPKSDEEAALQDMSLTLCLPASAANPRVLLEPVRTKASARTQREDAEAGSPAAAEGAGRRSPTVALTRLFEADLYRLPAAGDSSDTDEDICISLPGFLCTAPPTESPRGPVGGDAAKASSVSEKHVSELAKVVLKRVDGEVSGDRPAEVRTAVADDVADEAKSVVEEAKPVDADTSSVAEKPADAVTPAVVVKPSVKKSRGKSRGRRTNSRIEQAPELHLPTRQAKKSGPGVYKEPPLRSKLRR